MAKNFKMKQYLEEVYRIWRNEVFGGRVDMASAKLLSKHDARHLFLCRFLDCQFGCEFFEINDKSEPGRGIIIPIARSLYSSLLRAGFTRDEIYKALTVVVNEEELPDEIYGKRVSNTEELDYFKELDHEN